MDEAGFASVEVAERCVRQALGHHPNDLSRLIYLTSLRDYNSGTYLHPFLSLMYGESAVHHALESYHRELFRRLIASSVEEYVHQLRAYICYTRSERRLFIRVWKSLQAYRAAIPLEAAEESIQIFVRNVGQALSMLESDESFLDRGPHLPS